MRTRKQLDVYIDESVNFAPFSSFNRIYSVSFVFAELSEEVEQQKALLLYIKDFYARKVRLFSKDAWRLLFLRETAKAQSFLRLYSK